jgi:hypothetical protein
MQTFMKSAINSAALIALLTAEGCALTPRTATTLADSTICRISLYDHRPSNRVDVAQAEVWRRGLNCNAMIPQLEAQRQQDLRDLSQSLKDTASKIQAITDQRNAQAGATTTCQIIGTTAYCH